jgi:hypothetical protein
MTTPTLADALAKSTAGEIRDDLIDALAAEGASVHGVDTMSAERGLVEIHARSMERYEDIRSLLATAGSKALIMAIEDTEARDSWLDYMATGWFGLTRFLKTKATHRIRLVASAAAGPYPIAPRALLVQTAGGIQFKNTGRTTADLTAAPGTVTLDLGGTRDDLEWQAELPGTDGNVAAGQTWTLVTTLAGVTATNPAIGSTGSSILVSGTDTETSESLSLRMDARWDRTAVAQLPGSLIEWIFESFEVDGLTCSITRWKIDDTNPNGPGSTDVYLYPGTAEELARVDAYLQARRALGTGELRVMAAAVLSIPFSATLFSLGTSTETQIEADATASIAVLESLIDIGGIVYLSDITKALRLLSSLYDVTHDLVTTQSAVNEVIDLVPTFTVV